MKDFITYSDSNPHPKWEKGWYSKARKYPPITNFNDFECIEEITVWDKVNFKMPSHTYVLNRAGHLCGYFINSIIDKKHWVEFGQPYSFSKSHRKFNKVSIESIA